MTDPAEYGREYYLSRPPWNQPGCTGMYPPPQDSDYSELGRWYFKLMLAHLDSAEIEFLRDAFVEAAISDPDRPETDDLEAYDWADLAQDEWEIRRYGRVISSGSVGGL